MNSGKIDYSEVSLTLPTNVKLTVRRGEETKATIARTRWEHHRAVKDRQDIGERQLKWWLVLNWSGRYLRVALKL